jgi:hypothetical protein
MGSKQALTMACLQIHNGLLIHYHTGKTALHCILCSGEPCIDQLAKEWNPNVPYHKQERYDTAENCIWSELFVGGLNDWKIVVLTPTEGCNSNELDITNAVMVENIEVGPIGVFHTEYEDADG